MEDTLDFSDLTSPISPGLADCHRRRSTCFALRILLGHQEICSSVMEDPETLLRLLGYGAFWQDEVIDAIKSTLKAEGNDDILHVKPTSGTETTGFIARLKSRQAWNTYETTISRLYSQQPHLVIAALEANLARLKPKSLLKSPGNRNTSLLVKLLGLSPVESRLMDYGEARSYPIMRPGHLSLALKAGSSKSSTDGFGGSSLRQFENKLLKHDRVCLFSSSFSAKLSNCQQQISIPIPFF
jgi:hypothetical protein